MMLQTVVLQNSVNGGYKMALEKQMELSSGLLLKNSYHRITNLTLDYVNKTFRFIVSIYINQQTRLDGKSNLMSNHYTENDSSVFDQWFRIDALNHANQNPVERGYNYLKSLPDYENATDVLE